MSRVDALMLSSITYGSLKTDLLSLLLSQGRTKTRVSARLILQTGTGALVNAVHKWQALLRPWCCCHVRLCLLHRPHQP